MKSEYPYREIAPKVYMINEFNVADCYLLVGTERALLIDMGVGLGNLRAFVQRLTGGLPLDVVATHGHVDHIGGRGQFPRVCPGTCVTETVFPPRRNTCPSCMGRGSE